MARIKTERGIYHFSIKPLYVGRKKIDKTIAKDNLLEFNSIAKKNGLKFGLVYGTLLGAVRERDFIDHDEDIDLFVLDEDKHILMNMLFELRNIGFEVARYDRRGLISIIKNNEYIDFYIFSKFKTGVRTCCGECILERFLEETVEFDFQTEKFLVPKDYLDYLHFQYGSDWQTPIPYSDFSLRKTVRISLMIKEYVKSILPDFLFYKYVRKNERAFIDSFYRKARLNNIELENNLNK